MRTHQAATGTKESDGSRGRLRVARPWLAAAVTLVLVVSCGGEAPRGQQVLPAPPAAAASAAPAAPAAAPSAAAAPSTAPSTAPAAQLKPLLAKPEKGPVGTSFTLSGDGLPKSKALEIFWVTVDGSWDLGAMPETVEFYARKFTPKRISLGRATTTAEGTLAAPLAVPEDYGEVHDIVVQADGQDLAKGGFEIERTYSVRPLQGPIGTPITIEVKGLGWTNYENTAAILWNNQYAGFISAVTGRGTAVARIRAPGKQPLEIFGASSGTPYLNVEQSPVKYPKTKFVYTFTVTEDAGAPASMVDWPDGPAAPAPRAVTTASAKPLEGAVSAKFSPASGPILSKTTLDVSGLAPSASLDLYWMSVKGNRVSPSGWNIVEKSLGKLTASAAGTLRSTIEIPDDLGGFHVVKVVQNEKTLAEAPYYVERSIAKVTPTRVKAGEVFQVQVKGIGWTELDNGVAATYDNNYIGFACGFNSQGDVTMNLVATGAPGTHLIDFYPMIYLGHGKGPWNYYIPQLTFARDNPGLALGYRIPVLRMAIEVVP